MATSPYAHSPPTPPPPKISYYTAEQDKEWDEKMKPKLIAYLKPRRQFDMEPPEYEIQMKVREWREKPRRNRIPEPIVEDPAIVARRAMFEKDWEENAKQGRIDFDRAAGRSEEEIQKRLPRWKDAYKGGPGSQNSWRLLKRTPEEEKKADEWAKNFNKEMEKKNRKVDRRWYAEENYGRMVRNLGRVPKGNWWDRGELKGGHWKETEKNMWYNRLGRNSSPEPAPKRVRKSTSSSKPMASGVSKGPGTSTVSGKPK